MSTDARTLAPSAWELARRAAATARVDLRPLDRPQDLDAILGVMAATWGGHEPLPREMLTALADSGNVPYGADAEGQTIGYVLSWAGVEPQGGLHVHSHMLATLPDRRHAGVGYALKLAQRAQALEQGIARVRWTFDPLIARNGYFNLHKLGAVADRFGRDHYGAMGDAINEGERSDRFTVRWDLEREPGPRSVSAEETALGAEGDEPVAGSPGTSSALLEIPREYPDLRERDRDLATRWRDASATAIERCLEAGLVAAGFRADRSAYVFVRPQDVPA